MMLVCSSDSSGSSWHSYDGCSLNSNHNAIVFMVCIEFLEMHMEGDLIIDGRLKRKRCMLTLFCANRKETVTANAPRYRTRLLRVSYTSVESITPSE